MLESLDQLETGGLTELKSINSSEALEAWRIKYLGSKGALKTIMPKMKQVPPEQKPRIGQRLNEVKTSLESAFEQKKKSVASEGPSGPFLDVTEPGLDLAEGRRHVLSRTIDEITEVFARMGFSA